MMRGQSADAHILLPRAGVDDAAGGVAGDWAPLAQAELGPLDAPQHHCQRCTPVLKIDVRALRLP